MVKHRLTVEEAKSLMLKDPKQSEYLATVGFIFITIIAVIVLMFIWWVI